MTVRAHIAGGLALAMWAFATLAFPIAMFPTPARAGAQDRPAPSVPDFTGAPGTTAPQRGRYLASAAGCEGCHTDKAGHGAPYAGGRAFKTPYGTFYSPNITPDPKDGIGTWTQDDFTAALRRGTGPKGRHFYPVFPYPAFTLMSKKDMADIYAYLRTLPSQTRKNRPHDLHFPYSIRALMGLWNMLYLRQGPMRVDPRHDAQWNRGAYLARALGHCDECHTPRDALGGKNTAMAYGGTPRNPEGISVPNITTDRKTGIGTWSAGDLKMLFQIGMLPDGDFVGGVMAEVVSNETSRLDAADLDALIAYVKSIPPIEHAVSKAKKAASGAGPSWQ